MSSLKQSVGDLTKQLTGKNVPDTTFKIIDENNQWHELSSSKIFDNKKVILFSLPGAFTPTCSTSHLPRYDELASTFFAEGVDDIYCMSVNDTFVMNAWQQNQSCKNIQFLPDGNGDFNRQLGLLVDKENLGFGQRSWRYSMLVNNGVIEKIFIEADVDGDPFDVSDADTMLNHINANAEEPKRVAILSKKGCPFCAKARRLLTENNLNFEEVEVGDGGLSMSFINAISGNLTAPQVFIDGQLIGGSDDLEAYLNS